MKSNLALEDLKNEIKTRAKSLGFSFVGFAAAEELSDSAQGLRSWLDKGYHAGMAYMGNYFDLRVDVQKLFPGAKTVIVFAHSYFPHKQQIPSDYTIAKYAYGQDYHQVLKKKLAPILELITDCGHGSGRIFVDSAPLLERQWAQKAGLGWIGKNTLLITPQHGSFFFLSEIVTDLEFVADAPFDKDFCGTCSRCVDHCPTKAIEPGKEVNANKCLSYWTIEHKGSFSAQTPDDFAGNVFGCDICQDVCPWNSKSIVTEEACFSAHEDMFSMTSDEWENLDRDRFNEIFRKSSVKRAKFEGFIRNVAWLNSSH